MTIDCSVDENSKLRTCQEHVVHISCSECKNKKQFVCRACFLTCSELRILVYCTCNSISNLLSYFGLVEARISASEKHLPVPYFILLKNN